MANESKYGFIPRGSEVESAELVTEKTVSCKVSPAVWKRWRDVQQRLAPHGEVSLAGVVRTTFLEALDGMESLASQLEAKPSAGHKRGTSS
jgi:hypothetical protein